MSVRFFGQFLLESGVIGPEQLLAALAHQAGQNLKFGATAMALGLLTQAQVEEILVLQRTHDLLSGEAAVKLGALTVAQVEQVLRSQRNSHVMVGEALVATGALDRPALGVQLAAFHADQANYRVTAAIPKELDPSGLGSGALDLTVKLLERLGGIPIRRVMARAGPLAPARGVTTAARVPFTGDANGFMALRAEPRTAAALAGALLGEPVPESDTPTLTDALSELLNMVAGNVAAQAAQKGRRLELGAPVHGEPPQAAAGQRSITAELGSPGHELYFVLVA